MKKIIILILTISICLSYSNSAEILQEITVNEGDTLWSVASFYLKDPQRWPEILKYNKLLPSDPNVILPGMKLKIPIILIKENLRAAYLIYMVNDVRYRRKSEAEWKKAWLDMELYNEDGLRTFLTSKAKVRFPSGEILQLDENSLIILRPERTEEEISLLSGGVRASQTKILANASTITPQIKPKGIKPDFKTKVKEDKTTLVEVYEGSVDVMAEGKKVTVPKGYGTEVKFRNPPSMPRSLPPKPELDFNRDNITSFNDIKIEFPTPQNTSQKSDEKYLKEQSITSENIKYNYHLQISTSNLFRNILVDEINEIKDKITINFQKYNLEDGIYYYRLAYVDDTGFEGQYSQPIQFVIDTTAPKIEIITPKDGTEVDTDFVDIEGRTEPGIRLEINEKIVFADETGKFTSSFMPQKGKNTITIIAQDKAGNKTSTNINIIGAKNLNKSNIQSKMEEKTRLVGSTALGILTITVIIGVIIFILQ